jgi:hypothetical protein
MIRAVKQNRLVSLKLVVNGSTGATAVGRTRRQRTAISLVPLRIDQYRCYRAVGRTRRQRTDRLNFTRESHPRRIDSKPMQGTRRLLLQDKTRPRHPIQRCRYSCKMNRQQQQQSSRLVATRGPDHCCRVARRESSTSSMRATRSSKLWWTPLPLEPPLRVPVGSSVLLYKEVQYKA